MPDKKAVRTIVVVGAGIMGRGIAHVSAMGGFTTVLNDISDELLEKARDQIQRDLEKGVELGKIATDAVKETLSRLTLQANLERAVTNTDLVIEAAPEKI